MGQDIATLTLKRSVFAFQILLLLLLLCFATISNKHAKISIYTKTITQHITRKFIAQETWLCDVGFANDNSVCRGSNITICKTKQFQSSNIPIQDLKF